MSQLIVRNLEPAVVRQLKRAAVDHGRSAEEEHREILRNALLPKRQSASDFKSLLESVPTGDDRLFDRDGDLGRSIEL